VRVVVGLMLMMISAGARAQCGDGRYSSYVFPTVNKSTETYSTVYNLKMDVYQPAGDTFSARPLIILAHGGSFISGNRASDVTVDSLCVRFARRGYVTVSIDYRLTTLPILVGDSALAVDEVIKAIGDGKAAIRYFVKDAATANTYKIDTNNIYVGGNSAGAVLYMHVGYVTDIAEYPDYIDTALAHNGGFEGNSGNAGYSTKSKAVINLAGALNMSNLVSTGDVPSVNVQGDLDNVVPYNCGYPLSGSVRVQLCGLGTLEGAYVAKGINHMSMVYPGDGHVPWSSNPVKFNTVDSLVRVFLFNLVCPGTSAVHSVLGAIDVILYPNPASGSINITSPIAISDVTLYDHVGRQVFNAANVARTSFQLDTAKLAPGTYSVKLKFANKDNAPVVKQIVVR